MKNLLCLAILIMGMVSCGPSYQTPPYQYIQSPQGQQMVVVKDNDGMEFLMEYALFTSLMNSGGYATVVNHYYSHPGTYVRYNRANYGGWRSFKGRSYNSSYYDSYYERPSSGFRSTGNNTPSFKNTTPATNSPSFRNTTPSNSSGFRSSSNSSSRYTSPSGGSKSSWGSSGSGFRSSSSSSSSSWKSSSSGSSGFRSSTSTPSYKSSSSSSSSGFRSSKRN